MGVVINAADRLPAARTSTKWIVTSTPMSWSGCFRRSSCISASAKPMQSWSATRSSPWFEMRSQPAHFFVNRHTSTWPRSLAANALTGSPRSWDILLRATLATLGFCSLTANALMALSRSASAISSSGVGPMAFLVTSLRNLASQHSRSWIEVSWPGSCTACE